MTKLDVDKRRVLTTQPFQETKQALLIALKFGERVRVLAVGGGDVSQKQVDLPIGKGYVRVMLDKQNFIIGVVK